MKVRWEVSESTWVESFADLESPSVDYVLLVTSYAGCYILAALLLAIALFQRREVG